MKLNTLTSILVSVVMLSRCKAVPDDLEDTWSVPKKCGYILKGCPELLPDPPYTVNVPHETDCTKFYICQKGNKVLMSCASFLQFNSELGICDWPKKSECNFETTKRQAECLEDQQTPHESVCNQYYRCVYGQRVLKICPDKMVFNGALGRCDFQYNVVCETVDRPVDEEGNVIYDYLGDYDYYDDFLEDQASNSHSKDVTILKIKH